MSTRRREDLIVAAQETNNPNTLIFHSRTKLTDYLFESGMTNDFADEWCPVMKVLIGIEGVAQVQLRPYWVIVEKGTLFTWPVIAPKIMKALIEWHNHNCFLAGIDPTMREILEKVDADDAPPAPPEPQQQASEPLNLFIYGWTGQNWGGLRRGD